MDRSTLAVEWVSTDELHLNPANPRHNDEAVPHVAASIQRFGWRQPVVARPDGEVIAGNTRLKAAQSLGMTEVPVVRFEGSDLEATAYGIADNRSSEFATWDEPALAELLEALRAEDALDGVGYSDADIDALLAELDTGDPADIDDPGPEAPPQKPTSRTGDLWLLGTHRLLCGDSTNLDDLARLMDGHPPTRPRRWHDAEVSPTTLEAVGRSVGLLQALEGDVGGIGEVVPHHIGLDREALDLFKEFVNEHGELTTEADDDVAAAFAKIEGYAARLAGVIHLMRQVSGKGGNPDLIDATSMSAGIELARWFAHEADRVYALLRESEDQAAQRELIELITLRGGRITVRQLAATRRKYRAPGAAQKMLDGLIEAQLGFWEKGNVGRAGRNSTDFVLTDEPDAHEVIGTGDQGGCGIEMGTRPGGEGIPIPQPPRGPAGNAVTGTPDGTSSIPDVDQVSATNSHIGDKRSEPEAPPDSQAPVTESAEPVPPTPVVAESECPDPNSPDRVVAESECPESQPDRAVAESESGDPPATGPLEHVLAEAVANGNEVEIDRARQALAAVVGPGRAAEIEAELRSRRDEGGTP
jgi:ParB-like chromosome segregation protein Spo0J